ncbi:alpha,alpha-phosphotrehalase [Gemelliphila palaticanis]|uniref:Alpha,alpha-phosphotrehalase n=2 Tax=Gemelliphila palaticanis TaxID=81950 RepID=A0ABX2SZZ7_9BACL|nr:alpha,alpha-phosphotrehalase [Gemella palaticanis]MBF0715561.1 alpha,alpha-phosphotrehalase [Gemella palaticanis]NYS47491.1 alpha,alpha-phosphotrehalase [Gemella palaticanis]
MYNFKDKVIYQLYPKSFKDANNDGVGDIRGIIEKIPYLANLGIDMIWLNPMYKSPQKDNGYDISDYKSIDPIFGTMEDFEEMVEVARKYNIDFMLDMVFNHTSIEHEWFQKALSGDKKYQDYYIIRDAKSNGDKPTNWLSKFGGPAWEKFGNTDKYYLHLYDVTQADLNWRNPEVREELIDIVNFWLKKGVKGFRFDVLNVIGKDEVLIDSTGDSAQEKSLYTDKPVVHEYIKLLNNKSFGNDKNIITVGEMSSTNIENGILYTNPSREELSMIFSFHHLKVDYDNGEKWSKVPFDFEELKKLLNDWQEGMSNGDGWNALFWNNHDQPRSNSRFGDVKKYPYESATMLAQTLHLLRGTPYIYQGEEIGMTNPSFDNIDDYVDIETHNAYKELLEKSVDKDTALEYIKEKSRDNSRTPMQWDNTANAGFSKVKPWLKVANNYKEINVQRELDTGKIFNYYKKLIKLRKDYKVISEGTYRGIQLDNKYIYSYIREYEGQKLLVLNNFYGENAKIDLSKENLDFNNYSVLIGNYENSNISSVIELKPYETIAILLK